MASLTNAGTASNSGTIAAGGTLDALTDNGGTFTNNSGGSVGQTTVYGGDVVNNGGTFNAVRNYSGGTFTNTSGTAASLNSGGVASNGGTITPPSSTRGASPAGSGGTFTNTGTVWGPLTVEGGTVNNTGTLANVVNTTNGVFDNTRRHGGRRHQFRHGNQRRYDQRRLTNTAGTFTNTGTITNAASITGGTVTSTSVIGGATTSIRRHIQRRPINAAVVNAGTFNVTGALTGVTALTNNNGTTNINGNSPSISGALALNGGTITGSGGTITAASFTSTAGLIQSSTVAATGASTIETGTLTLGSGGTLTGGPITLTSTLTLNSGAAVNVTGITNNGGVINVAVGAKVTDSLTNSGAVNNAGTYNADVTNNGGAIQNAATGVWNGALTANTGLVNNAGTWNATAASSNSNYLVNSGTWTQTGNLTNGGTLTTTGVMNVSGVLANNAVAFAAGTLNAATLTNSGALTVTGPLTNTFGATTNSGVITNYTGVTLNLGATTNSGTIYAAGSGGTGMVTTNALTNSGVLDLRSPLTAGGAPVSTASTVTVNGVYTGGGTLAVNTYIDGTNKSNQLILNGASSGVTNVAINQIGTSAAHADVVVVQNNGGGAGVFTAVNPSVAATPSPFTNGTGQLINNSGSGILQQWFGQTGGGNTGSWVVRSDVNTAAVANIAGSIGSALASLNSVFNEPTSAFIGGPANPNPNTFAMGAWSRVRGGDFHITSNSTISSASDGSRTVGNSTVAAFGGFQGGVDGGYYNIENSGWSLNGGLQAGYVSGSSSAVGAQLDIQQPFGGIYGALSNGSAAFDVTLRRDGYNFNLNSAQGYLANNNGKFNGTGYSGVANAQYRFTIVDAWFLEPSVALLWSNVSAGQLNLASNGVMDFSKLNSETGRIGARLGTVYVYDTLVMAPFIAFNVYHEFAGPTMSNITFTGIDPYTVATSRVDTFTQTSLGIALSSTTPGLSGFVRGDFRYGSNITGGAINAGIRDQF